MNNYRNKADSTYWNHWPSINWEEARLMKSGINPEVLERLAWETGYPYPTILRDLVNDIKFGARLGVADSYRVQSSSTNAPSAYELVIESQIAYAR